MTVKELIEANQLIVDVCIEVRVNGMKLLDYLGIGCNAGRKPPYPRKVPKDIKYINSMCDTTKREGNYIDKSINTWDDGRDYWQIKMNRIPKAWLDLEVYSWSSRKAYRGVIGRSGKDEAEEIIITALPAGTVLSIEKPKQEPVLDGQMSIDDLMKEGQHEDT